MKKVLYSSQYSVSDSDIFRAMDRELQSAMDNSDGKDITLIVLYTLFHLLIKTSEIEVPDGN